MTPRRITSGATAGAPNAQLEPSTVEVLRKLSRELGFRMKAGDGTMWKETHARSQLLTAAMAAYNKPEPRSDLEHLHLFDFVLACFEHRLHQAEVEKKPLSATERGVFNAFVTRHRNDAEDRLVAWATGRTAQYLDRLLPDLRRRA